MHPAVSFSRRRVSQHDDRKSANAAVDSTALKGLVLFPKQPFA
jgi:hypothetical protein